MIGFREHVLETREPLLVNESTPRRCRAVRQPAVLAASRRSRSCSSRSWSAAGDGRHLAPEPRPRARLHRRRRAAADDARRQPQRRARERAARPRDASAERRARADQQRAGGARGRARAAGDLRRRRRQDPGDLRRPGRRHRRLRRRGRAHPLPVRDRAWRPLPGRADAAIGSPHARRWRLLETKAPMLVTTSRLGSAERDGNARRPVGEPARVGALRSRCSSGDERPGPISLQNLDRTNAFTESDVRLLTTLAGSLSVALENARLVDETRQRNAELALINSVQRASPASSTRRRSTTSSATRSTRSSTPSPSSSRSYDETTGSPSRTSSSAGERLHGRADCR